MKFSESQTNEVVSSRIVVRARMYALRLGSRHFITASKAVQPSSTTTSVALLSRRNHVYDKRNYVPEIDDFGPYVTQRPWDHFTLRANQNRQRRFGQYMLWFCSAYLFWGWFKCMVHRNWMNKVEKWDYQTKYWRYAILRIYHIYNIKI